MDVVSVFANAPILTTAQLRSARLSERDLTRAVRAGSLIRVRRGHYALPSSDSALVRAVRIGGRLGCVSAADRLGVWVAQDPFPHVSMDHGASRLRSPGNRTMPLSDLNRDGCTLHWWPTQDPRGWTVSLVDALVQIVRCQPAHLAIAALDSALNAKLLVSLDPVAARLPRKYAGLLRRVDARSMSGIETIVRLWVEDAGMPFDIQGSFVGIGDVDLVLDDRVVIEVDGRAHHSGQQVRDYARDAALAARGYIVLRFDYAQVMFAPELVMAAIRGALATSRGTRGRASRG